MILRWQWALLDLPAPLVLLEALDLPETPDSRCPASPVPQVSDALSSIRRINLPFLIPSRSNKTTSGPPGDAGSDGAPGGNYCTI